MRVSPLAGHPPMPPPSMLSICWPLSCGQPRPAASCTPSSRLYRVPASDDVSGSVAPSDPS